MQSITQERTQETVNTGKILVYIKGSEDDEKLIESAGEMALEEGSILVIMTAVKRINRIPDEFIKFVNAERFTDPPHYLYYKYVGEAILAPHVKRLQELGVPYEVWVEIGDEKERIEAVAKSLKPYRIVVSMKDFKGWGHLLTWPFSIQRNLKVDCPITIIP